MSYEDDDVYLDLLFGSTTPVGENLMPNFTVRAGADDRYDQLPEDFRKLLQRVGLTKTKLRALAREAITKSED